MRSPKLVPFIISLALFMEALDTTIINTAIPVMSHSLGVNPVDLKIALISYLLSLAILIPISGWIGDKLGVKRVFMVALLIFIVSSAGCGFAHNVEELVIGRVFQGLGGSLTLPLGRLIILRTFKRHEVVAIMSQVIIVAAFGMMLGPVLGGLITHYYSWPWIFWVNIPVGIITSLLAHYGLPASAPQPVHPLDKTGFILFGTGLAGLTFGLSAFSETTVPSSIPLGILFGAILLFVMYFYHSRHQLYPVVKTELFQFRTFQTSTLGNLLARLGFGGVPFLVPLLLQVSLHYSPQLSGLLVAPTAFGVLVGKSFTLMLLRWWGYKRFLILNTIFMALSLWSFLLVGQHTSFYLIGTLTFIFGVLVTLQYGSMNSLAYSEISPELLSAATSIMSTLQQVAQSFGVATSALLIRCFAATSSSGFILTTHVFHETFFMMGMITLCCVSIFWRLKPDDGHQMLNMEH